MTGDQNMVDTCDWCRRETNKIQIQPGKNVGLCIDCCPDITLADVMFGIDSIDDSLPSEWHFMDREEREAWLNGMSMEEIMEKHDWYTPPERPIHD